MIIRIGDTTIRIGEGIKDYMEDRRERKEDRREKARSMFIFLAIAVVLWLVFS